MTITRSGRGNIVLPTPPGESRFQAPGFGLPLDWSPEEDDKCFNHGVNDFRPDRMTVHEVSMLQFMDAVTDKPDWNRKVFDKAIVAKWREESTATVAKPISETAFEWCLKELRDRASAFEEDGLIRALEGGARVVKSDTIINGHLRDQLRNAVQPLLDVEDSKKDWHPGSNEQVLNLVHPSLYPLVYGRSRILPTGRVGLMDCTNSCGKGELSSADQETPTTQSAGGTWGDPLAFWSKRFQWLPAEVRFVGEEGTEVEFVSYINNLRPDTHKKLYEIISNIASPAILAWNEILIQGHQARNAVRIPALGAEVYPDPPDWIYASALDDEDDPEHHQYLQKLRDYLRLPNNPDFEGSDDDEEPPENIFTHPPSEWIAETGTDWEPSRVIEWKYRQLREVATPEPGEDLLYEDWVKKNEDSDASGNPYPINLEKQFREQGLQIIVKLTSIELSPAKPDYDGGSWHVEGMLNEHIVGTAIYYFDTENCTQSRLRFRQESFLDEMELQYEQDDHGPLSTIFGTRSMREEPAVQEIGSVDTREGRLLVFPNTLQHKVESFSLIDRSKPGHRRMLVLLLVDPNYRITSTANVAPQQEDLYLDHLRVDEWNRNLPAEISMEILNYSKEYTMSLEEAKTYRLELMAERTKFKEDVKKGFETYNLCEH